MSKTTHELASPPFEIIVYGATSFVGKILCHYLVDELKDKELKWAIAARSASKLDALKKELGEAAAAVPLFVADAHDENALRQLCSKTAVIISTVGPYALYGETLVKVCAQTGTDYCDLTGEAPWVRRMISKYEHSARESGARIVNSCGFDSIPSDLGVYFLQQQAMQRYGHYFPRVKMRVKGIKGGASGGTIASAVNLIKEAVVDPDLRKELNDPYSLCPAGHSFTATQHNVKVEYDTDYESWASTFIMAAVNTRIVLRTNALMEPSYHNQFLYDEAMLTGDTAKGKKRARRAALFGRIGAVVMAISPLRWLALIFLPKPGEGPTPEQQRTGYYDLRFVGISDTGDKLKVKVTGDRDPGYGSTAKMLAQVGLCLARDVDQNSLGGGFWTPARAMGDKLIQRLEKYAGISFGIDDSTAN